jgi:hypothetical protein
MLRIRAAAAGLALAVAMGAAPAALAPAAFASAGRPAAIGSFHSWHAAQRAAGFRLKRPTRLHGLTRSGLIVVMRCEVTGKLRKRNVFASYGKVQHRYLNISQNNSGGPCGNFGEAKKLRTYLIHGARATLFGVCGMKGEPSCHKRNIFLFLTWRRHHIFYVATSHDERRHVLVNFARSLRAVR